MSAVPPVTPVPSAQAPTVSPLQAMPPALPHESFAGMLGHGLQATEAKLMKADELVRRFALDDSVPVHQVTYALEEARLSVELAMQVRTRLLEAYRDLMNMQL